MSVVPPPPLFQGQAPSPERTLRRLFLTVFLRGMSARGLAKQAVPKSIAEKMRWVLIFYGLFGLMLAFFTRNTVLMLSTSMHGLTFLALGMFVASTAGEALFNKEEAEILLHRPVTSQMLLRAKGEVLAMVSFSIALAFNFGALILGALAVDGSWLYPIVHLFSTALETVFSVGVIVLVYQICLKRFGREKLDGAMTTLQILITVSITLGSQILPRMAARPGGMGIDLSSPWIKFLPPAWFAAWDDAIAGSGRANPTAWILAGLGLGVTMLIAWLAFYKLADAYESGLQNLSEAAPTRTIRPGKLGLAKRLSESAPVKWFLPDTFSKASFQLISAYMFRDRDVKLRLYPGIVPMMIMPIVMLLPTTSMRHEGMAGSGFSGFMAAFGSMYMCVMPPIAIGLLQYSQQYRASDIFLIAPVPSPSPLIRGARIAVLLYICLPMMIVLEIAAMIIIGPTSIPMVLTGAIAMPVFATAAGLLNEGAPLSNPTDPSKRAATTLSMFGTMFLAVIVAGGAAFVQSMGYIWYFLAGEAILSYVACRVLGKRVDRRPWKLED